MIFTTIKNWIIESQKKAGYSSARKQLLKLSDRQLDDLGFSRELLMRGVSAYPWREEEITHAMADNVTNINVPETEVEVNTPVRTQRPKAA